jgi:hypothetical protein
MITYPNDDLVCAIDNVVVCDDFSAVAYYKATAPGFLAEFLLFGLLLTVGITAAGSEEELERIDSPGLANGLEPPSLD